MNDPFFIQQNISNTNTTDCLLNHEIVSESTLSFSQL